MAKRSSRAKCANPVSKQYALGQSIGVNGTPAIVLADGQVIPGYQPAHRLASWHSVLNNPVSSRKPLTIMPGRSTARALIENRGRPRLFSTADLESAVLWGVLQ
jgi:hypothetical protein